MCAGRRAGHRDRLGQVFGHPRKRTASEQHWRRVDLHVEPVHLEGHSLVERGGENVAIDRRWSPIVPDQMELELRADRDRADTEFGSTEKLFEGAKGAA